MQLNPVLSFNGHCKEAFKFYEQCLGGKIQTMMTWGESPMADNIPTEFRDKIMHVSLIVGESALLGSDSPSDRYEEPRGFSVAIQIDAIADAERIFRSLAEGGQVTMPLEKTFWAERFGMVVDRFGIPWMVNCGPAT